MFLRIRGKGASPENSQAALLHLRGFRHTHTRPIKAAYRVAHSEPTPAGADGQRAFVYSHFPVGIQSSETLEAQRAHLADVARRASGTVDAVAAAPVLADPSAAVLLSISDDRQRMVWKETWNVYDIIYDEVNLLPANFAATNALLKALRQAERDGSGPSLSSAAFSLPKDFVRPLATIGNKLTLVSTHYYRDEVIPLDVWEAHSMAAATDAVGSSTTHALPSAVVVVDLTGLDPALAYQKAALELAWSTAFATCQTDNPLLRASSVVVRLPYDEVPCSTAWLEAHKDNEACAAVLECYDFIGEHIAQLYRGLWLSCPALVPLVDPGCISPLIHFVGRTTSLADDSVLRALLSPVASNVNDQSRATPLPVVVLGCDTNAGLAASAEQIAEAWGTSVSVLVAPVQALIDGGDEPWDPYTQKERERLNFCPCCGDCDHTHEGAGHGHSHGH